MKTTYIIKELQNANSEREGNLVECSSLSAAKRYATRNQFYQGTVLRIEYVNGGVAAEKINGKWVS